MTTRWRPEFDPQHLYFITTTAVNRRLIFQRDIIKRILVDSLYFTSVLNHVQLYAFVVMPNHIHVIIQCPPDFPPKDWARAFKTSTSQMIIRFHQMEQDQQALNILAASVTQPQKQRYKVWETGYLAKSIVEEAFLIQKLTYLHNNPVQPHWQLAVVPEDYLWSSARFYLQDGGRCLIPIDDVRELLV